MVGEPPREAARYYKGRRKRVYCYAIKPVVPREKREREKRVALHDIAMLLAREVFFLYVFIL
jgi:hypothetical protein